MRILITLLFSTIFTFSYAQDQILMMNGQTVECKIIDDFTYELQVEVTKKNGKKRTIGIHRSEIFSVTKEGKAEVVFYAFDEEGGNYFTEDEMRIFMAGEQDARAGYNEKPTFYVGMALGAVGGFAAQGGLIATFIVPVLYTFFQFIPVIKIHEDLISNPTHQYNEAYAMGYSQVARSKKVLAGLSGSAIGMVIGFTVFAITDSGQ